ncbi:Rid family hydrolase [Azospirillum halopraeferens]|uniref:Rid family hydrolase n=1 Tax=Azospirillum halopraeferens TaxID=34010 RepID=UPI0004167CDE|nr:Rid family hydrolase [Azospirillum halopraeferens]
MDGGVWMMVLPALALAAAVAVAVLTGRGVRGRPAAEPLPPAGILPPALPFSEAVAVGRTVYLSGQIGIRPGTLELVNATPEAEFGQAMDNLVAVLRANGMTTRNLVKVTVMLRDMADWPAFNAVYESRLERPYPARSAFAAAGLALGARVEIDAVAVR